MKNKENIHTLAKALSTHNNLMEPDILAGTAEETGYSVPELEKIFNRYREAGLNRLIKHVEDMTEEEFEERWYYFITLPSVLEMKPCPFCKINDHLEVVSSHEGPAKVVKCWGCGALGPYGASNEKIAFEYWNEELDDVGEGE